MRIMIKGGVWKNTEDEILKAAVMKYGKNQWARISSLLVRKSAKQCKARWYEWLDPSIKKTEWTREEDEKLLHLAKLMPTQWRTIAPIVGRTPSQCLERYEKLLDAVCSKDENYEPSDDPRKLRPGEIDPNPESKPARPDPVDMDEDEKEMLSEARARLANTRGKKAKRKAREKQLEEARRLASLQKRRELKAAGIDTRKRKRKRKGIDYNAEIPFEKRPPPGFYDVVDEDRPVEQPSFPTTIEELEGKRRVDIEAQLRKQDIARNKIAQRQDAPSAILQANKLNDPEAVRKRSKLMLPAPQISDHELEEIAKMGYASDLVLGSDELAEGSGATRALLANYSQTPRQGMTPLRTPQRTPAGKADAIMMEAQNLARLRESQTPLLGGENPELHPSDFSGVTPRKREIQTPNPIGTPLASPGPMGLTPRLGMTPSREGYSFGVTPKGTPFRDELHINEDVEMRDSAKLELQRQTELKRNLRSGLTNLPQPKNEYQIVVQPIPEENEEDEEKIEDDMSDRIAREKAQEQARQEALLRKRSKVLQRELPRPPAASLELIRNLLTRVGEDKSSFVPPTLFEQADEMINKEMLALLEHDNAKYPLEGKIEKDKKKGKHVANGKSFGSVPEIEDFEEDELKEADSLIKEEIQFLRVAMGHENESLDEFVRARDTCQEDLMYFPGRNTYGLASVAGNSEKLVALQNEFEIVKQRMDDEAKKATKLEQKIKVLTHGYQTRAGKLWSQIEATYKQMNTSATELECFQALQKQEVLAASSRINSSVEEVNKQKMLEESMQCRYGDLLAEYERIQRLLEEHRVQLQIQEEIAAKNRALEEEIAAKNRAVEEEKIRALEEEIAAKNRAVEEEKNRAIEEEIAAKNRAVEEEIAAKNRAVEEIAAKNRVEEDKNHDIEEEATTKSCTPMEEIKAQDGTPDEELGDKNHGQLMMETDGICVPDSSLHQTDGFLEESMPSGTSSVKEITSAEVMMVQAGTPDESLGDENRDQSMMETDGACVSRSCLSQTDGILEEPSVKEDNERLGDENRDQSMMENDGTCVPDSNMNQTDGILEEPSVKQGNERLGDENQDQSMMENDGTCVPDCNLNQTDGIFEEPMSLVEEKVLNVETDGTCVLDSCLNQTDGSLEEPRPSEDTETPSVKEDTSEQPATQESGMVPEVSGDVKEHIIIASAAIMENIASSGSVVDDGMIENCSVEAAVVGTGNADAQSDEHAGDFGSQMIPPVLIDSEETILPHLSNQILVESSSCIAVVSETVLETNTISADSGLLVDGISTSTTDRIYNADERVSITDSDVLAPVGGVLISEAVEKVDVTVETEAADGTEVDAGEVSTTETDLTIQNE